MKCSKTLAHKQYFQVSSLCGSLIIFELFVKTCHMILQSLVWRCNVGVLPKDSNMPQFFIVF